MRLTPDRYQFNTELYNPDVVVNILIKALTSAPQPDFNLCLALLGERDVRMLIIKCAKNCCLRFQGVSTASGRTRRASVSAPTFESTFVNATPVPFLRILVILQIKRIGDAQRQLYGRMCRV